MFSEAHRWMLGNSFYRSAAFCTSLAGFHNNMFFLTVKGAGQSLKNGAGQSLKNAALHVMGGTLLRVHTRVHARTDAENQEED